MHESVKNEVAAAVETAAIALINANESGDRERYQNQLNEATSDIHQLYMHLFMLVHSKRLLADVGKQK